MIEQKLKDLFDMQSFVRNARIEKLVQETNGRYGEELTDDMLGYVSAAGETDNYRDSKNSRGENE